MRLCNQLRTMWRRTLSASLAAGALVGTVAFGQVGGGGGSGPGPSVGPGSNGAVEKAGNKAANLAQRAAGTVERTAGAVNSAANQAAEKVDNAATIVGATVDAALNRSLVAVAEVRAKVITDVEGLDESVSSLADDVEETVKKRLDAVQEKLDDVKQDLRGTTDETADQVRAQLGRVREKLEGVRKDLDGVAEQTTGTAREVAQSLSTRVNETIVYLNPTLGANLLRLNDVAEGTTRAANLAVKVAGKAVDSALENASDKKGRLGVSVRAAGTPVTLSSVYQGSVAARAGLQPGDQLLKLNGAPIGNVDDLRTGLGAAARGDGRAVFEINRGGRLRTIEANFGSADDTASRGVDRPNE
jgi:hypothetical protein